MGDKGGKKDKNKDKKQKLKKDADKARKVSDRVPEKKLRPLRSASTAS